MLPPRHVRPDPLLSELRLGGLAIRITAEGEEEVDLGAEAREHHRGDAAASRRPRERALRMDDLSPVRQPLHGYEVHPLDMSDHRDVHTANPTMKAWSALCSSNRRAARAYRRRAERSAAAGGLVR